ncbi:Glycine-rich RNA-binding protein 4 mitochondrial [Bienertia sinuspersici]
MATAEYPALFAAGQWLVRLFVGLFASSPDLTVVPPSLQPLPRDPAAGRFFEYQMMRIAPKFQCLTDLKSRFSTVRYNSQLFVSRLSFYTTYDDFRGMFSPFGNIKEAKLVMDNRIGRTKGFGFVTFETEVEAQNAIKALNGKVLIFPFLIVTPFILLLGQFFK